MKWFASYTWAVLIGLGFAPIGGSLVILGETDWRSVPLFLVAGLAYSASSISVEMLDHWKNNHVPENPSQYMWRALAIWYLGGVSLMLAAWLARMLS